jgi:hypothetical protein
MLVFVTFAVSTVGNGPEDYDGVKDSRFSRNLLLIVVVTLQR